MRPACGLISFLRPGDWPFAPFIDRSCPSRAGPHPGPRHSPARRGHLARRAARHTLTAERQRGSVMAPRSPASPASLDLLAIDDQLSPEERLVRDTVRAYVGDKVLPNIADWFEAGVLPRELVPELGKLGLLGMQ